MRVQVCKQGRGHYEEGINNQDFYYAEKNLKIITDGCDRSKYSEAGTRLFLQYFSKLENKFNVEKFEENVKQTFLSICSPFSKLGEKNYFDFIENNMLFTIIACFEEKDKFIVKYIGDGYIISVNLNGTISYIRLSFGKTAPYYAYNVLKNDKYSKPLCFKTMEFSKKDFKNIGIASDGFSPIADKKLQDDFEVCILGRTNDYSPEGIINCNPKLFLDDVTILM